jgi:hypothetical protein
VQGRSSRGQRRRGRGAKEEQQPRHRAAKDPLLGVLHLTELVCT